jgi:DNA replication protein DnaC
MVNDNYFNNTWKKRISELQEKNIMGVAEIDSIRLMLNSPDKENAVLAEELLKLKIESYMLNGLTNDQTIAFIEIINYIRGIHECEGVILKGYAGTGKTYLINKIVEYITIVYPQRKIAITAPTNKATYVLADSSFLSNIGIFETYGTTKDKVVFCTIHKLLGSKEEITEDGKQIFVSNPKEASLGNYDYLIIDEISMLNDDLFNSILQIKKNKPIKLILLGDPAQIPPVNKQFCEPLNENSSIDLLRLSLSEIVRQKGNHPIVSMGVQIRNNLSVENVTANLKTDLNSENQGIVHIKGDTERFKVRELIETFFKTTEFTEDPNFIKIIAWRNKSVSYLNKLVRECLYGPEAEMFVVGDKLIADKPLFERIQLDSNRWGDHNYIYPLKANTSDEFVIKTVSIVEQSFTECYGICPIVADFTGKFWELEVTHERRGFSITIYVIHQDSKQDYINLLNHLKKKAVVNGSDYWVLYYNVLKWSDRIIYNYAITAHKAQGSTYEYVILIEEDLDFNKRIIERNRIKYTSYTRASNCLYVLK